MMAGNGDNVPEEFGRPVSIVSHDEDTNKYILEEKALEKILCNPEISNLPVSLISITGAFRKGKSFFMNLMLDYALNEGKVDWDDPKNKVGGFEFKSGVERTTSGILLWSKPFIKEKSDGGKIAILLADTQGLFDSHTTVKEYASIFALTLLTSSCFIYNVHHQVQEDDMNNLLLFTEYGKFLNEAANGEIPFENLTVLVRDWQWNHEHDYGISESYLNRILDDNKLTNSDNKATRQSIKQLFRSLNMMLLPYPGKAVATSKDFDGALKDIDSDFLKAALVCIENFFDPKNIKTLRINDTEITASQLMFYFTNYMALFHDNDLPEPKNIYLATAEASNEVALTKAKKKYSEYMDKVRSFDKVYKTVNQMNQIHKNAKLDSINIFRFSKKMGDQAFCDGYEANLSEGLDDLFSKYLTMNEAKKRFSISSFLVKATILLGILFFMSSIFRFIGLKSLYQALRTLALIGILFVFIWLISKFTGDYAEFTDQFEKIIDKIWNEMASNVTEYLAAHFARKMNPSNIKKE